MAAAAFFAATAAVSVILLLAAAVCAFLLAAACSAAVLRSLSSTPEARQKPIALQASATGTCPPDPAWRILRYLPADP